VKFDREAASAPTGRRGRGKQLRTSSSSGGALQGEKKPEKIWAADRKKLYRPSKEDARRLSRRRLLGRAGNRS